MADPTHRPGPVPPVASGLCESCRHRELLSSKRSTFVFCAASRFDPDFARYPALPVWSCRHYSATS